MISSERLDGPKITGTLHETIHRLFSLLGGASEELYERAVGREVGEAVEKLHHVETHGLLGREAKVGAEGRGERAEVGYAVVESDAYAFAAAPLFAALIAFGTMLSGILSPT